MKSMVMVLAAVALFASADLALAQTGQSFGGYACTVDCSGHAAGYVWAEENAIDDENACPQYRNRNSYYEGCLAFVEDPNRGADLDDDGKKIGEEADDEEDEDQDED